MKPVAWDRATFSSGRYLKSTKNRNATAQFRRLLFLGYRNIKPSLKPLNVRFYFIYATNDKKKLKQKYKCTRPDLDNLEKFVMDAGNKMLWDDDALICCKFSEKTYGERDEIRIEITEFIDV